MNDHSPDPIGAAETRRTPAAPRPRPFTADEFERMGMANVFHPDERVELIAGEIVVMSAKGRQHEVLRTELTAYWMDRRKPRLMIATETPLRLNDESAPEPDFIVYPVELLAPDVRPGTVLLVTEIAGSSLAFDNTTKAALYAAAGVREYWVIDAVERTIKVHRQPEPDGYAMTFKVAASEVATPELAPELALRLDDLAQG